MAKIKEFKSILQVFAIISTVIFSSVNPVEASVATRMAPINAAIDYSAVRIVEQIMSVDDVANYIRDNGMAPGTNGELTNGECSIVLEKGKITGALLCLNKEDDGFFINFIKGEASAYADNGLGAYTTYTYEELGVRINGHHADAEIGISLGAIDACAGIGVESCLMASLDAASVGFSVTDKAGNEYGLAFEVGLGLGAKLETRNSSITITLDVKLGLGVNIVFTVPESVVSSEGKNPFATGFSGFGY